MTLGQKCAVLETRTTKTIWEKKAELWSPKYIYFFET